MARLPRIQLDVAWDSLPFASSPTWETVFNGILSFNVTRGRTFRLDRSSAGTCSIRLLNNDGALDPDYTSGPLYGRIKVGRKARLRVFHEGATYTIFTGFLKSLPQSCRGFASDEVELVLVDAFHRLSKHKITTDEGDDFIAQDSGARIAVVLDAIGFPGSSYGPDSHRVIDVGNSQVASMGLNARPALEHILHIEQTEMGRFYISGDGKAIWLQRHTLLTDPLYIESQIQFGGFGGIPFTDIVPEYGEELLYNEVRASRVNGDEQMAEDTDYKDDYGGSVLDRGEMLSTSDTELESLTYYLLDRHKEPITRFRQLSCKAHTSDEILTNILGLDLGYRASIHRTHKKLGYTVIKQAQIEQISHEVDYQAGTWLSNFQLSDADSRRYWLLNDATYGVLGTTTIWGF